MNKFLKNKFRVKIFLTFLVLSLIPLSLISLINIFVIIDTRQENIAELESLAIESASEKITKFLNQKVETFNLVINGDIGNISDLDSANLKFLIENLMATAGDVDKISFIDNYGQEIIKRGYENETLVSVTEDPLFWKGQENKKYFGEIKKSQNQVFIKLVSQIENKSRKPIGVIMAEVNLSQIQDILNSTILGKEGYLSILDDNGIMILAPSSVNVENTAYFYNFKEIKALVRDFSKNRSDFITYQNNTGESIIINGKPLEPVNWFILSQWPEKDAFSILDSLLKQSLYVFIITILFVIILSFISAKKIDKPIAILSAGANEIAKGNLGHKIELKTNDEFETLGENFNNMINVLRENKKLKDEFVFISAHELRTPVTAIKGYISMMLDGSLGKVPEKIRSNLEIVFNSNERLVQLVQDLLVIARSESGKMKIEVKPLPIGVSIDVVINELKEVAGKKGIAIEYKNQEGDKMVKADDYKLKEVLVNLIGNAIKYTEGNGSIEITHELDSQYLITHIKDHGMGMTKEEASKLFSKFYRVKNEKTEKIEGTGLGLFICKEIVERMGGKIWLKSEPGKGSIFSFSLLLAQK